MTLATGRPFLMIPGPTNVPEEVLRAMHRPAVDIYVGPLVELTDSCLRDLKAIFKTQGKTFIYASNGHGGWESALTNTLSRGDKVLVLDSGRFARGWGEMAAVLGLDVEVLPGDWRKAVDAEALRARLEADREGTIKAVLVVQVDTASGVVNDIARLRKAIDAAGHQALFMVDTIASLGCVPFEMDKWGVDLALTGAQKGLMTPPGLAFVAANEKALDAHERADLKTQYWDWTFRQGEEHYQKYCGTPPEHLLFGFREALDILMKEGLDASHRRHKLLGEAVRKAVNVWAKEGALELNILEEVERSNSVTVVLTPGFDPAALKRFCEETCNVTIGGTIGEINGKGFRIGHMGYVNAPMVIGTLGAIEMGLAALNVPHGRGGVQAAVDHLTAALAD
ncbi:aminotransferase class V-fold PLP-dependent enzyme [Rhizobiales bacterium]|uniref:pyridoxal-phosphate-dependent aminotransferase family protein n=1 Tax=Hongsoonwoonella zoysiae TaxID=2821844 RepID=UPI001560DE4B|nr:aminotransferase class V-fold PLP-dependent enzyme [Hongsoonwoonella zoysiae]NRG16664.1 aminotransferase class V-fold PLP-dependent enzyme [Hongsoonwoonella zoysiae]